MYKIEFYKIDVENSEFVFLGDCTSFWGLYYENTLNDTGSCLFNLDVEDNYTSLKYLTRMSTIVVVKKNNTCVWFGPIANISGSYSDVDGFVQVIAYSYLYFFKFRNTAKSQIYSQEEQCEIAWNLIDTSQNETNGTLLITEGLNPVSKKRDRTYETYKIADALTNLTDVIDGFDFSFEATFDANNRLSGVLFNTYYPNKGSDRSDIGILQVGQDISTVQFDTISKLCNTVTVEGSGTGTPLIYTDSDTTLQKAYTRIEEYEKASDISEYDSLEKHGEILMAEKVEGYKITLDIDNDSKLINSGLVVGDFIVCNIQVGDYLNLNNRKVRIDKIPVSVDTQGVDKISLEIEIYG